MVINGASGSVGTFAVQIAKYFGADVTGVCSTRNLDLVRSIGADAVIDYTQEDFTSRPERYDLILDCIGNKSIADCRRILNPKGRLVMIGGPHDPSILDLLAPVLKALISSPFMSRKAIFFVARSSQNDLNLIAEMIVSGKLKPVIDRSHSFNDTPDAMRYLEEGNARGKVIVAVSEG